MNYPEWRRTLRRELSWLMALKVGALALLWWLFFSHCAPVDGQAESRQLALTSGAASMASRAPSSVETRRD
ncbi:MAG: hypothetical protein E6K24_06640 [Gammaproteobacteria bacterium]|nr:MAG: hypothetical protein E6K24_06640 [Gammaproteobacteria bacterium]